MQSESYCVSRRQWMNLVLMPTYLPKAVDLVNPRFSQPVKEAAGRLSLNTLQTEN